MNNTTRTLLAVVIVAILAVGGYLALKKDDTSTTNSTQSTSTTSPASDTSSTAAPATNVEAAATITYDGNEFTPATVNVKAGDTVKVTNKSNDDLSFNSDPHPTHTDEPELNVGTVGHNESATFKVTKTGSWGYHNHFDQSQRGTIVVQ